MNSSQSPVRCVTLAHGLKHYQRVVSILKKGYEQERYRVAQLVRSELGAKRVHEITSVDIASYRDARLMSINAKTGGLISPATVRLEMSLLSNFFDLARIEWGFTASANPCADVRKPKPPPGRERRLTAREERLILRYAAGHSNPELYSIVVIALSTAMRQSEILGLHWEHINFRTRVAHLPETKNGSKRDVPLSPRAREAIARMGKQSQGKIFAYTKHGIKSTWRFMLQKLSIEDLHFHDLRHEAISRFFELGTLDMMEIAAISGHKSVSMLKRYTHLRANRLVHKLEGNRNKARLAVLRDIVPYPAIISREGAEVELLFPDFEQELRVSRSTLDEAITAARSELLRALLLSIREGKKLPKPDEYLTHLSASDVMVIDPLAEA